MSLVIDTGNTAERPNFSFGGSAVWDGILDSLPANATQHQIDSAVRIYVLGKMREPKKIETVRKHLLLMWPDMIAPLAEREPLLFDEILNEFSERASFG